MTFPERPLLSRDTLLRRICAELRLSDALHDLAEQRYLAVAAWLTAAGSPLAAAKPHIYAQGSLRIRTTVRPRGRNEFDLDLVLELQLLLAENADPMKVLDAVERRMRENAMYRPMVERKNRCIRLNYADEFHLDILPGVPNPAGPAGAIWVPDCGARAWKDSNPKGFAVWFESSCITEEQRQRVLAGLEPLPPSTSAAETPPLTRVVQLMKRSRDVMYEKVPELAPISIVLTTLCAKHYAGHLSEEVAFSNIVQQIVNALPTVGRLVVPNPTNEREDLSERWNDPKVYDAFVKGMKALQAQWSRLMALQGLENIIPALEELFGEDVVQRALRNEVDRVEGERARRTVGVGAAGVLITSPTPHRPVPRNTFYGDPE